MRNGSEVAEDSVLGRAAGGRGVTVSSPALYPRVRVGEVEGRGRGKVGAR